ncbi:MAG: hypothetical protein GY822_04780 [Deltaproteobacteria bacterium]|nr:hypothetical protein [Deltaproteobacteria bacterium]
MRDLLNVLVEASKQAVRLHVEGRSVARGSVPKWLDKAAAFDFSLEEGSTILALNAKPLRVAAPEMFQQADLFSEIADDATGVDLMFAGLADVIGSVDDSDNYDAHLAGTFGKMGKVLRRGFDVIQFINGATHTVNEATIAQAKELEANTPPDQRIRVVGVLDKIGHSDRTFVLKLADGTSIRGRAPDVDTEQMRQQFGHKTLVEGDAAFRVSGTIRSLQAVNIGSANEQDEALWSKQPHPLFAGFARHELLETPGGLASIIGQWPGDEDDETFDRALRGLS